MGIRSGDLLPRGAWAGSNVGLRSEVCGRKAAMLGEWGRRDSPRLTDFFFFLRLSMPLENSLRQKEKKKKLNCLAAHPEFLPRSNYC